ncbi:MAG TPA: OsmC family peroxiredoxin [Pseudobdellovibrionaceae bacterium]|jgi:osmotically inducible protein OsmC
MQRKAQAIWRGSLQLGKGEISTLSGALKGVPYTFNTRFSETPGTNPEELIAAAHASCFAMACSAGFSDKGFEPENLEVTANVTLQKLGSAWAVTSSLLQLKAQVAGVPLDQFTSIVEEAKNNCPISKLLNLNIALEAHLEEAPPPRPWAPPPPQ